jgi:hypothetical protein
MELNEAIDELVRARETGDREVLRQAAGSAAAALVERAGDGARAEMGGVTYAVREVTWPVEPEGGSGGVFACPHPTLALLRDDAVIGDIRSDYWDGSAWYRMGGERLGRWSRFRMGNPGDRGYDLHLATEEELSAFAREANQLAANFGLAD